MITLSNGYKLPEDGDLGDVWFDALEDNIQRLNDHTHNGVDSEKLDSSSLVALSSTIVSGDFSLVGTEYEASLTLPSTMQVDETLYELRNTTSRERVYGRVERTSVTQVKIYLNSPLDLTVVSV